MIVDVLRRIKYKVNEQINYNILDIYGQQGEDEVIDSIIGYKEKGFFIDVGASHPIKLNNTYRFYKRGWTGINIDPNPIQVEKLNNKRPRDRNLLLGLGRKKETLTLWNFGNDGFGSSFSKKFVESQKKQGFFPTSKNTMQVDTLKSICDKYVGDKTIDLLNVDVEGHDMEVLKGNNWKKYKPKVLCLECMWKLKEFEKYLKPKGYFVYRIIGGNVIFVLSDYFEN